MLSGALGENNKYTYNLSASHDNRSGTSANVGAGWTGSVASVNGSYSTGDGYNSTSLGLSGAVVAHSGGVTFTPYNSDTYALVEAKDAKGAKMSGLCRNNGRQLWLCPLPVLVTVSDEPGRH
jgi:outer membrane usher protein